MTPAFPIECYRPAVVQVAESVFQTMLGIRVAHVDGSASELPAAFTAAVYYVGAWSGAVLLECSAEHAIAWTAQLMSLPEVSLEEDAPDALGELANVLAGNLKPILPPGVGLSIPSVVKGSNYSLRVCGGNLFERMDFADACGLFRITLVEVLGEK